MIEVTVPTLGESVNEGTVATWLKQDGDWVEADENLCELETDKAMMEIPSPAAGKLQIEVSEGTDVEVGQLIAKIDDSAEKPADDTGREQAAPAPEQGTAEEQPDAAATTASAPAQTSDAPRVSPAAERLAEERGIDPATVTGTGKDGMVTKSDIVELDDAPDRARVAPAPGPRKPPAEPAASPPRAPSVGGGERRESMSRIRQRIASRMVEAQQTAAILTTFNDVDMSAVMAARKQYKETFEQRHGVRLGFMSFFGRACILALQEFPEVNAFIDGNEVVYHEHVHLGIAVGTPRGLVVPVVRSADQMSMAELEANIQAIAGKARDNKITPDDLTGGTFSITNGGVYGSMLSTPLLNPPQSGILGMHRIEERPVVRKGEVVVRPMMYLALSYDHRMVDGEQAVTFLVRVKERLEDPTRLLLEV